MSFPIFVPNTGQRIQEEIVFHYGYEVSDWVLGLIKDELGWIRPVVEIETMQRVIEQHIGKPRGNHEGGY